MPLDLALLAAQYTPLEELEPQLKSAKLAWATAVNALDAASSQLQADKQELAKILPKIQVGVFSTTDTNDIATYLKDQLAVNADDAKIPALRATVDTAFEKWNGLYAQYLAAVGELTKNPGQVEQVHA